MTEYKHGGDIYSQKVRLDFSANINPLGMPEGVKKSAEHAIGESVHYPDPLCRNLIFAISKKESIKKENILIGNGAADLIYRFVLAKKPKRAVLLAPTFSEYEQALSMIDCDILFHLQKKEYEFELRYDFLEKLREDIDVIFLCNPNNPTGRLIEDGLLIQIIEKCKENDIFIFIDECFLDFVKNGCEKSLKYSIENNKNILILKAFTKLYAMPGLRLGYCFSSNHELISNMNKYSQSWSVSIPAQDAGIAALKETEFVEESLLMIDREKKYLIKELENLGIWVGLAEANYIFFYYKKDCDNKDLYQALLEEGILIRSCHNYRGLSHGYYRIAVKQHEENVELLKCIAKIIEVK